MAISRKRQSTFECNSEADFVDWLTVAADEYIIDNKGPSAFSPFELFVGKEDSLAEDIAVAVMALDRRVQRTFIRALNVAISEFHGGSDRVQVFMFFVELAWALESSSSIEIIERRLNPSFVNQLFVEHDRTGLDDFCEMVFALSTPGSASISCIKRLVEMPKFNPNMAPQALLRLVEIDPDNWAQHFALTRDLLFVVFSRIRGSQASPRQEQGSDFGRELEGFQDRLSEGIFSTLSLDRFAEQCGDLLLAGSGQVASDSWFLEALIHRKQLIELTRIANDRSDTFWIASVSRPGDTREVHLSGVAANLEDAHEPHLHEMAGVARSFVDAHEQHLHGYMEYAELLGTESVPSDDDELAA